MLLVIDNFDSFVHNLARYFNRLGQQTLVVRNDAIDAAGVRELRPAALVLSPGPCAPEQAGAALELVRSLQDELPMLGVCLGHQILAQALGGRIVRAPRPVHGQTSAIEHEAAGLFAGLPAPLTVCRYHSLVVEPDSLPPNLRPTAWTRDHVLMAFADECRPLFGVQFHPEAILTDCGYELLANFLRLIGQTVECNPAELSASERPPIATARCQANHGPSQCNTVASAERRRPGEPHQSGR